MKGAITDRGGLGAGQRFSRVLLRVLVTGAVALRKLFLHVMG
jgi:hypothetical protein